ncbi:MAG: PKD domain-containing protein [Bacteroidales bacterium]|nr:PKD domain-containing protein [Bacteroidales bacterium]
MQDEERDNGLENLFRNKLEENEMVTGDSLTDRFMHRLGRREFLRFNPSRFNIYYLTAALAGVTVAGFMLFNGVRDEDEALQPETIRGTATAVAELPGGQAIELHEDDEEPSTAADVPGEIVVSVETSSPQPEVEHGRETAIIRGDTGGAVITLSTIARENQPAVTTDVMALSLETSAASGCVPLHVSFACNATGETKILWDFGDGGSSSECSTDYIYDIPGKYHVTLTVTDSRGRITTASTSVDVRERPRASFEVIKNDQWDEGDKVTFVNMSTGAIDYLWDFGDGTFSTLPNPSYRYDHMGTYDVTLIAWSAGGCADSLTVTDLFTDRGMYIRFPNAFVPNSGGPTGGYYNLRTDEASQVFHPVAAGIDTYNLKIYSKTGLLVFETNEIEMGWDGWYRGELCTPGVYVWKVRGTYRNGQSFIMAGDVTLLNY